MSSRHRPKGDIDETPLPATGGQLAGEGHGRRHRPKGDIDETPLPATEGQLAGEGHGRRHRPKGDIHGTRPPARRTTRHTADFETALAGPLYDYLSEAGYTVRSEVKDCDIAAVKDDELLIIELKRSLNLALVVQGVRRQRLTDSVYLAIPRPSNKWKWWKESRGVQHLLRRLELGLILVSLDKGKPPVEVVFHPLPFARRKRAANRRAVLHEIASRTADYNRAGSHRTKLATAYRENALHVACCLLVTGPSSPAALRALGTGPKTLGILRLNPYGWFERIGTGVYRLAAGAASDLDSWPELKRRYLARARRAARRAALKDGTSPHGPA